MANGKFLSTTIPGKFQTYLRSNKFILGFIDGETARLIKESKTGIVVNPSNSKELANTIIYLKKKYDFKYILFFDVAILFQIFLGIVTLISGVEIRYASLHQLGSILVLSSYFLILYKNSN